MNNDGMIPFMTGFDEGRQDVSLHSELGRSHSQGEKVEGKEVEGAPAPSDEVAPQTAPSPSATNDMSARMRDWMQVHGGVHVQEGFDSYFDPNWTPDEQMIRVNKLIWGTPHAREDRTVPFIAPDAYASDDEVAEGEIVEDG